MTFVSPLELPWPHLTHGLRYFEDLAFLFKSDRTNRHLVRLDLDEAAALFRLIRRQRGSLGQILQGVEIGRFKGGSTVLLATALAPHGRLLSIDSQPIDDKELFTTLFDAGLDKNVYLETGTSDDKAFTDFIQQDFVFIDGDHTYDGAKNDHNLWGARVRRDGYVIHHDLGHGRPGATQVEGLVPLRNEILEQPCVKLVEEVASLMVFQVVGEWVRVP